MPNDSLSQGSYLAIKKSPKEAVNMAEKADQDPLDELVSINLKILERERRAFKVWCAERGMTQVEAFRRGIALLRQQDGESE